MTDQNTMRIQRLQKSEEEHIKELMLQANKDIQRKTKQNIIKFLTRMEKKKEREKRKRRAATTEDEKDDFKFVTQQKKEKETEENKEFGSGIGYLRAFVPGHQPIRSMDVKASKHYYHPPSKLIVSPRKKEKDFLGLPISFPDYVVNGPSKENAEAYKLTIHGFKELKGKSKFRKYYSGGPDENESFYEDNGAEDPFDLQQHMNEFSLKVITKFQAIWRGRKVREEFKRTLEKHRQAMKNKKIEDQRAKLMIGLRTTTSNNLDQSQYSSPKNPDRENHAFSRAGTFIDLDKKSPSVSNIYQLNNDAQGGRSKVIMIKKINTKGPAELDEICTLNAIKSHHGSIAGIPPNKLLRPLTSRDRIGGENNTPGSKRSSGNQGFGNIKMNPTKDLQVEDYVLSAKTLSTEGDAYSPRRRADYLISQGAKGLLLKHRKLFNAVKTNNYNFILTSYATYSKSDVNARDSEGNTPLYYAAKNGNKEICDILIKLGAEVSDRCSEGNTPLHMAFASNQLMVIMFLISRGANAYSCNNHGQTPAALGSESTLNLLKLHDPKLVSDMTSRKSIKK